MKFTAFLLVVGCMHLSAKTVSQTITFYGRNVRLSTVLAEIEKQTNYLVFYNEAALKEAKPVTVSADKQPLQEFLQSVLLNQQLDFIFKDKYIIIRQKLLNPDPVKHDFNPDSPITGIITDEDGNPLSGINVIIKGTSIGTMTDANGKFVLKNIDENAMLVISSIGYETKEINVNTKVSFFNISLKRAVNKLDEAVIIAYGNTTKRLNTGNINSVKSEDIEKQPVSNPLLALEGRVPSLFITQSSGISGAGVITTVQGQNSMNKGSAPFYVIDGVPYISELLPNLALIYGSGGVNGGGTGSPLNYINPSDIESITVLKDADATAIYGSRAANGAILITTKKGKAGEAKIDLNLQNGWGKASRRIKLLNTPQYLEMRHEAIRNDGLTTDPYTDIDINGTWDTSSYTDWQKKLIGGTAQYTNLNGTISGGNATSQYLIGGTYHYETPVIPGHFADRKGALHFSINSASPNQKFHIQVTGNYLVDNNKTPYYDPTQFAVSTPPDAPALLNKDGSLNWALDSSGNSTWALVAGHPLARLQNIYRNKTNNLTSNGLLSYNIIKGLKLQANLGFNNLQSNEVATFPLTAYEPALRPYNTRRAQFSSNNINSWIVEPQLTYTYVSRLGKLEALFGTTINQINSNGQILSGIGFNNDAVMQDIKSASTLTASGSTSTVYRYNALFSRLNFVAKDKYILDLTARRDGSSRFGPASQFHNFAAVGAAWIFSSEEFINALIPALSFGKLKASYGTTGNDQIGDYQFMDLYNPVTPGVPFQGAVGLAPIRLYNPLLQWEESKKMNFGLDLGFLRDRIMFNVNFYRNRSSNQLISHQLPAVAGFRSLVQNFPATVQNQGWEFVLNTTIVKTRSFQWSVNANATLPGNKLLKYDNLPNTSDNITYRIGMPITQIPVYHLLGVDKATGVYQFEDSHGNPTTEPEIADLTRFVNLAPTFFSGLESSFTYKSLSLTILIQYVKRKGPNYYFGYYPGVKSNQPTTVLDRWKAPDDVASIQRFNTNYSLSDQWDYANYQSDVSYADASYARVKNISLSWKMPQAWNKKAHIHNLEIFAQGQNLFTITHYVGLDPETLSTYTLPPLRIFTIGLQTTL